MAEHLPLSLIPSQPRANQFARPFFYARANLNGYVSSSPQYRVMVHLCKEIGYKMFAVITFIAFGALGITALVFLSLSSPSHLPLAIVSLGFLLNPIFRVAISSYRKGNEQEIFVKIERGIASECKQLTQKKSDEFRADLRMAGIMPYQIKGIDKIRRLDSLKAIFARYIYWQKRAEHLRKSAQRITHSSTAARNGLKPHQLRPWTLSAINAQRKEALTLTKEHLITKTRAAFMYGLIMHPFYQGDLEDLCHFHLQTIEQIYLDQTFADPEANKFLVFHGKRQIWINKKEAQEISISGLADRLFRHVKS